MIKDLDFIYFDGNTVPGKLVNGAGIYGMDITVGNSRQPTTIKLDVVSENGDYGNLFYSPRRGGGTDVNLSTLPMHQIDIGNPAKLSFKNLALTTFSENKTPDAKTATLTFKDRSILFDKIQVGLLWKHSNGIVDGFNHVAEKYIYTDIPVNCEPCNTFRQKLEKRIVTRPFHVTYIGDTQIVAGYNGIPTQILKGYFVKPTILPAHLDPDNLGFGAVHDDGGGYIILGREKPKTADCSLRKCDYNFSELLNAIEELTGFTLAGAFQRKDLMIDQFGPHMVRTHADKNPHIRKDWDGSLREVLNNWCDLFQMTYTMGFDGNTLIGIDMRGRTSRQNLETIKRDLESTTLETNNEEGFLLENIKINETIDETEKKELITNYSKPPRVDKFDRTLYYYEAVDVLTPEDVVGGTKWYGRTESEYYNSIALAKFSDVMREVYLAREQCLEALGFRVASFVNPDKGPLVTYRNNVNPNVGGSQKSLFQHVMSWLFQGDQVPEEKLDSLCDGNGTFVRQHLENNPALMGKYFDVYIGYYTKSQADKILQSDKDAADMLGQYCYFRGGVPNDTHLCDDFTKRQITHTTEPPTEKYKGYQYWPQALKQLMGDQGTPPRNLLSQQALNQNIKHLNIGQVNSNMWGTSQKEIDDFLKDPVVKEQPTGFLDQGIASGAIFGTSAGSPQAVRNKYGQVSTQLNVGAFKPIIATIGDNDGVIGTSNDVGHYITGWNQYIAHQQQMEQDEPERFISGEKPAILVIPKGSRDTFKIGNTLTVNTGVFVTENPDSFLAQATSDIGTISTEIDSKCEKQTYCERSLVQQACDCVGFAPIFDQDGTTFGLSSQSNSASFANYATTKLAITYKPWYANTNPAYIKNMSIVFPCMGMMTGHIAKKVSLTETYNSITQIYGEFPGFYNGQGRPNDKIMKTDLQYADAAGELDPIIDPDNPGIINTINFGTRQGNNPSITLSDLHTLNRSHVHNQSQVYPKMTMSFDINGTAYGPLTGQGYLSPASGLTSWNVTYGSNGVKNSFSFSTRPAMLPKKEDVISKIETRFRPL